MNYLIWTSGTIVTGACLYQGYKYGKRYFESYVMKKVMEELDRRLKEEENEEMFKPMHKNSAMLKIRHGGKSHSIYVPYDRKKSTRMLRKKVFLIRDGKRVNITQKPGIKYLVSAKDLGGELIIIEDLDGNVVHEYKGEEIPNCF